MIPSSTSNSEHRPLLLELPVRPERPPRRLRPLPTCDPRIDADAARPPSDEMPRSGFPWAFAWAILIVLGVEFAVRFADPRDVVPYELGHSEYGAVTAYIDALGPADVAFVGSSHTREGIVARDLRKHFRRAGLSLEVANYGLSSSRAETVDALVNRILQQQGRKPRLILYGLSPRDLRSRFSDRARLASLWDLADWCRDFRVAPALAGPYLPQVLRNEIGRRYLTLRYREAVRLRFSWWLNDERATRCPILGDELSPWHHVDRSLSSRKIPEAQIQAYVKHNRLDQDGEAPSDRLMQEALLRLARRCHEAGVTLVLFEMPISDTLLSHMPEGIYDGFLATVQKLAREANVPFVTQGQLALSIDETRFREYSHLNRKGARMLTRAIADQVVIPILEGQAPSAVTNTHASR